MPPKPTFRPAREGPSDLCAWPLRPTRVASLTCTRGSDICKTDTDWQDRHSYDEFNAPMTNSDTRTTNPTLTQQNRLPRDESDESKTCRTNPTLVQHTQRSYD
ncbi:hypothetical protein FRC07_010525, partial [Ceratobasidium sp. 392]